MYQFAKTIINQLAKLRAGLDLQQCTLIKINRIYEIELFTKMLYKLKSSLWLTITNLFNTPCYLTNNTKRSNRTNTCTNA